MCALCLNKTIYFTAGCRYPAVDNKKVEGVDTKRPKTKFPITRHPKLHITQKQNAQRYKSSKKKHPNNKTPKITKSPNLQNVQSYKMSKNYTMSKITKCPRL